MEGRLFKTEHHCPLCKIVRCAKLLGGGQQAAEQFAATQAQARPQGCPVISTVEITDDLPHRVRDPQQ
jgi:hypothetical protein